MSVALSIILTLLLTIANGYFSMSESALVAAKRAVLEPEAEEGDKRARAALVMLVSDFFYLVKVDKHFSPP